MADQARRVEARKLLFADGEGDDGDVLGRDALRGQLLVEADVGVAVDRRDDAHLIAVRRERHDVGNDGGPVGLTEGGVVDEDVLGGDALGKEIGLEDVVGRARIDVVGAEEGEALDAEFVDHVVDRRDRLLVRRGAGVEDVARRFLALVLDGVEHQPVQLLDHRQDRLAAHRGPGAEDHVDLLDRQQLARLLGKERPVRRRVDDDGLDLASQQAAGGVLRLDEHQHRVLERRLGDGHAARERVQDADLDRAGLLGHGAGTERSQRGRRREAEEGRRVRHRVSPDPGREALACPGRAASARHPETPHRAAAVMRPRIAWNPWGKGRAAVSWAQAAGPPRQHSSSRVPERQQCYEPPMHRIAARARLLGIGTEDARFPSTGGLTPTCPGKFPLLPVRLPMTEALA